MVSNSDPTPARWLSDSNVRKQAAMSGTPGTDRESVSGCKLSSGAAIRGTQAGKYVVPEIDGSTVVNFLREYTNQQWLLSPKTANIFEQSTLKEHFCKRLDCKLSPAVSSSLESRQLSAGTFWYVYCFGTFLKWWQAEMCYQPAKLEEVVIERFWQDVRILYRDHPLEGGSAMRLGRRKVREMSDRDILDMFNEIKSSGMLQSNQMNKSKLQVIRQC